MSGKPGPHTGPKCGARKRQGEPGSLCNMAAGWGTNHQGYGTCRLHGGNTRGSRTHALKQQASDELAKLARLDVAPIDNPLTALSELAGQVVAWKNALADRVNQLTSIRYEGTGAGEQLRAEVALFERALDRCNTVLAGIARLNIDERLVAIRQQQADMISRAVVAALSDAGLSGEALAQAKVTTARHLKVA